MDKNVQVSRIHIAGADLSPSLQNPFHRDAIRTSEVQSLAVDLCGKFNEPL